MKYTKFFVLILLSSLLLVIIVVSDKRVKSSRLTDEQVTIHVLEKWPEPENAPYFEEAVEAFEEENPNISIELEAVADEPIKDKLRTALGGGDAPDIAFSWSGEFAEKFIRGGAALDLTDYFEDDPEWKESFLEASLIP